MKPKTKSKKKPGDPEIESLLEKAWSFAAKQNHASAVKCLNSVLDLVPGRRLSKDAGFQLETLVTQCAAHEIDTALGQTVLGKFYLLHNDALQAMSHFKRALGLSIEAAKKKSKPVLHPGEFRLNYARAMMSVILSDFATATDEQLEPMDETVENPFSYVTDEQLEDIESSLLIARECGLPGNMVNTHIMMFYSAIGREDKVREYAQRIINDPTDSEINKNIAKTFLLRLEQPREDKPEPPTQRYN
jgi:tetratricopeptide (TPR) repeat protein